MAGGVPGMLLADLGADVVRVVGTRRPAIDRDIVWDRAWHRKKRIVTTDDPEEIRELLAGADVALVYGPEAVVEGRALGYRDLRIVNPRLVYARCRPSRTAGGAVDDYALLVEAAAGFCTQLAGHRPGPIFVDARSSEAGATFLLTTSVLALLDRRQRTGTGGWAETSLYDGLLATLGTMIGRSERAAAHIESYWEKGSTFPNFLYRCADGELLQVWFGGKGMYAALLEVLGDEPSPDGYYTDQVTGALNDRAVRWRSTFAGQPRDVWIGQLRKAGVACEPVLSPGEALSDPHLAAIGLTASRTEGGHHDVFVGSPIEVTPLAGTAGSPAALPSSGGAKVGRPCSDRLLDHIRVLDLSAFVAGPLAAQVLADMGAEVVKVEPLDGEAMRAAAYAVAACQRGKRSLALDLGAPEARPVVERLITWADVVLHNFRVGVAERLGVDAQTVARLNPRAVYCHASAFGTSGPRATFPGNDALMQAVTGLERAVGGPGNDPLAPTWIPIDMTGGWVSATGILAGLLARSRTGAAQQVTTSLLGAGMLLQSGVFQRDGRCLRQPELDANQTGYGPGYRLYQAGDGAWFALVVPDEEAWSLLRSLPGASALPTTFAPLRGGPHDADAREAEAVLESVFSTAPRAEWLARLDTLGPLTATVPQLDRDGFRRAVLDDPVNRQLGRATAYETADWGHLEQIGPLVRCGPDASGSAPRMIPGVGEHTVEILSELRFTGAEIDGLLAAKVARQL